MLRRWGLATFATGVYLTIQANIGVAPWDCFFLGVENTFGIKYGNVAVMTSLIVICNDLLLKEAGLTDADKINAYIKKDIDQINDTMPTYKQILRVITTDQPMIKTTTGKVKRYEETKNL